MDYLAFFAMALAKLLTAYLPQYSDRPYGFVIDNHTIVGDNAQSAYFAYWIQIHCLLL